MLKDKDIEATISVLKEVVSFWYLGSLEGPRAATADELKQYTPSDAQVFGSPTFAYKEALITAAKDDIIIVAGSFYTVAEILVYLQLQRSSGGK
ncbi:hypothetical protein P7F88_22575 [Vibrio hannami]|nr:hypothetical protein [Vibrio hannami]MDG3088693.1 hypothetical protein [Vibrio hannami]